MKKKTLFKIAGHPIKEYGKVFIIAEAGVNHNQDLKLALKLVDIAADSGADAIKFQTFRAEQVVTREAEMAQYQKKNTGQNQTQREMLEKLELPEDFYPNIINQCLKKNVLFMSTPHGGRASVDFLEKFKVPAYKIGSGDLTNYLLLQRVAQTQKPVILSSGMSILKEIKAAVRFLKSLGCDKISVLHCTSNYPCLEEEVNLLAMKTMMENLDVPVGYSDHSQGTQVALMAATLGAAVYEGHITLDKSLPGPDHKASADPQEFKQRVEAIRKVSRILGSPEKTPNASEKDSMVKLIRRSLVASRDLNAGHKITIEDLDAKRPSGGVSPEFFKEFLGKTLNRGIKTDEQIFFKDIK